MPAGIVAALAARERIVAEAVPKPTALVCPQERVNAAREDRIFWVDDALQNFTDGHVSIVTICECRIKL